MTKKSSLTKVRSVMRQKRPIAMLSAYDAPTARILEDAQVDIILVGDSVATAVLGYATTNDVTMDEMIHHARAVRRGAKKAFLIGDLPFVALSRGVRYAVRSAQRFIKEAGCDAVKLEWGEGVTRIIRKYRSLNIPVMGHAGLTPQSAYRKGDLRTRGRSAEEAWQIYQSSRTMETCGCFAVVLECVPDLLAKSITQNLRIPTIGIGAGIHCRGQVLVYNDVMGRTAEFRPRFIQRYNETTLDERKAVRRYLSDVRRKRFPSNKNSYTMAPDEYQAFKALIAHKRL